MGSDTARDVELFRFMSRYHRSPGASDLYVDDDGTPVGAALWNPPGYTARINKLVEPLRAINAFRGGFRRATAVESIFPQLHPKEPHWYLAVIGSDPAVHEALAELYTRWGEHDLARREVEQLVRIDPSDPAHLIALGEQLLGLGEVLPALVPVGVRVVLLEGAGMTVVRLDEVLESREVRLRDLDADIHVGGGRTPRVGERDLHLSDVALEDVGAARGGAVREIVPRPVTQPTS